MSFSTAGSRRVRGRDRTTHDRDIYELLWSGVELTRATPQRSLHFTSQSLHDRSPPAPDDQVGALAAVDVERAVHVRAAVQQRDAGRVRVHDAAPRARAARVRVRHRVFVVAAAGAAVVGEFESMWHATKMTSFIFRTDSTELTRHVPPRHASATDFSL